MNDTTWSERLASALVAILVIAAQAVGVRFAVDLFSDLSVSFPGAALLVITFNLLTDKFRA